MENATTRNKQQARHIESWLLNRIAIFGTTNVAKAIGMDKSGITRWKETMLPKLAMLLSVLEWGVVDDDIARVSRKVALYLEKNILAELKKKSLVAAGDSDQITINF